MDRGSPFARAFFAQGGGNEVVARLGAATLPASKAVSSPHHR